jgi:hypothetical protein
LVEHPEVAVVVIGLPPALVLDEQVEFRIVQLKPDVVRRIGSIFILFAHQEASTKRKGRGGP